VTAEQVETAIAVFREAVTNAVAMLEGLEDG